MDPDQDSSWDTFLESLQALKVHISKVDFEGNPVHLEAVKNVSRLYFRVTRPQLRILTIDSQVIGELDARVESLFTNANNGAAPGTIIQSINAILNQADKVSLMREYRLSDISFEAAAPRVSSITDQEEQVISTIHNLVPSAARSYRQAILDSADTTRISYRGPANEFREALREVLDHLAPDPDVTGKAGFSFEENQSTPTRKQKVRFILNARRTPRAAAKVPEELADLIDNKVAGITGATYTLANVTAHIETERIEVLRVRRYTLLVLSEILAIPE
jgi:hypothetical protein